MLACRAYCWNYSWPRVYREGRDPERFRELLKIGALQGSGGVAAVIEEFLPLADHSQISVIHDGNFDLEFFLHDGGKFRHGHLKSAVARYDPNFGLRIGEFSADRCRKRETHGA